MAAATLLRAPLSSSPRNCAEHMLAPRDLVADVLAAQDCEGGNESAATFRYGGVLHHSTDPLPYFAPAAL